MKPEIKIIIYVIIGVLAWGSLLYVLNGIPALHRGFYEEEKNELRLKVDSLERSNMEMENELKAVNIKADSIFKLMIKRDKKIIDIKKQDHEKSDSIHSFSVDALYNFFARAKTR
jgi:hypothetical protein